MKTKQNHRTSHMNMTRTLLPNGDYICTWEVPHVGYCGELRRHDAELLDEVNGIETAGYCYWRLSCAAEMNGVQIPVAPVEVEPLARWQVALWRWAAIVGLVTFWTVAIGVLRR